MTNRVAVIGAGLHPYGKFPDKSLFELASPAVEGAMEQAGIAFKDLQSAFCGHTSQGMTCGARIFGKFGATGLSITNIENASASGSYAVRGALHDVMLGEADVALALGIDQHPGRVAAVARPKPKDETDKPPMLPVHMFAEMAKSHMKQYGTTLEQLAQVSVKQHRNGALNPNAQYGKEVSLEQVHAARMVADPLTVLHCCPIGDGAAAVVLASEKAVARLGISDPVWITASVSRSMDASESRDLTETTAQLAYERAGVGPDELDMVELHDAFTIEEIMQAENLGLCARGEGGRLVGSGATELTGSIPINPSGGLLAMGHPLGPTGTGQIAEILWQLRGQAGKRQIPGNPKTGLAHMIGLGGTCIVHILQR